jgi:hypothetical protein
MGRSSLACFALIVCLAFMATPGVAKTIKVTPEHPAAIVDIPDDWEVVDTKRGFGVKSPDKEVFFWVETFTPDQRASVVAEHVRYFNRQGVEITGEPKVSTHGDRTVSIQDTSLHATWRESRLSCATSRSTCTSRHKCRSCCRTGRPPTATGSMTTQ